MTTPTQAQIEAAAEALCNKACNAICWHEQETQAEERDHWIGLATAALTAAAEPQTQDAILCTLMSIERLLERILQRIGDLDGRGD